MSPPRPATRVRRHPERGRYDRQTVDRVLDEGLICHLGFVAGGRPFVIPTIHARVGDLVYIHGSPASRMLGTLKDGVDVCLTVTILDGLVLARSAFSSSMNYRSAVVLGRASEVTDDAEKERAFAAIVEHVARGRWADCRWPTPKEAAATTIVRLPGSTRSATGASAFRRTATYSSGPWRRAARPAPPTGIRWPRRPLRS